MKPSMFSSMTRCRVILLLDLDCFYAQCERVRMGLDLEASVALMQWNSALAVSYPARSHGIKRGDSWDAVAAKSKGSCMALHLPIRTDSSEFGESDAVLNNVEEAYNRAFRLSEQERERIQKEEIGVRRFQHEGKACLERYRLASARIFQVISISLTQLLGKGNFTLERASIDELFIDVTNFCWETESLESESDGCSELKDTVVVGKKDDETVHLQNIEKKVLIKGCYVAKMIRVAVFESLGFTLSAGVSVNKMMAKLGASYGKPNGQAVIFPEYIGKVLHETPIGKVRNLGGKTGYRVKDLLPPNEQTLGSVTRLSLPSLSASLGVETGQWVFDICRGIDHEKVKDTEGVLVKSVTASKNFPTSTIMSDEVQRWTLLLAQDVVARVQVDSTRNSRYPKNCTIHYAVSSARQGKRTDRSLRILYPKSTVPDKAADITKRAIDGITAKEGKNVFLSRIGMSASDFERTASMNSEGAMDSFVQKAVARSNSQLAEKSNSLANNVTVTTTEESDLLLAQKLQKSFDREHFLLTTIERQRPSKKMKIDTFFQKRK